MGVGKSPPVFSGRRIKRGMYLCRHGYRINADCNGAANILRKAVPDAWKGFKDFHVNTTTHQGTNIKYWKARN